MQLDTQAHQVVHMAGVKEKQKVHLINWETVIADKGQGGLGIKEMKTINAALRKGRSYGSK